MLYKGSHKQEIQQTKKCEPMPQTTEQHRLYMQLRRLKESVATRQEYLAGLDVAKLPHVENLLYYTYMSDSYREEAVKPERTLRVTGFSGVITTIPMLPSLEIRKFNFKGDAPDFTFPPSTPTSWFGSVKSVMARIGHKKVQATYNDRPIVYEGKPIMKNVPRVSEARVVQDFIDYMGKDFSDVKDEEFQARFNYLRERMMTLPDGKERESARAEWKMMLEQLREAETAFIDFAIRGIIDRKTDEQILSEARMFNSTAVYFERAFLPEHAAKKLIKQTRKDLGR